MNYIKLKLKKRTSFYSILIIYFLTKLIYEIQICLKFEYIHIYFGKDQFILINLSILNLQFLLI